MDMVMKLEFNAVHIMKEFLLCPETGEHHKIPSQFLFENFFFLFGEAVTFRIVCNQYVRHFPLEHH